MHVLQADVSGRFWCLQIHWRSFPYNSNIKVTTEIKFFLYIFIIKQEKFLFISSRILYQAETYWKIQFKKDFPLSLNPPDTNVYFAKEFVYLK